jgi:hypothetical protein
MPQNVKDIQTENLVKDAPYISEHNEFPKPNALGLLCPLGLLCT